MKLLECLKMGYICGLDTVGESLDQFMRFSDVIPVDKLGSEGNELWNDLQETGIEDGELIIDILKKRYDVDPAILDAQLDMDLKELNKKLEDREEVYNE